MIVKVKKLTNDESILEVHTQDGPRDLAITRTVYGCSNTNFEDWTMSYRNYRDLEDFVYMIWGRMDAEEATSLNVDWNGY